MGSIIAKLVIEHPWLKEIQVCSNEGAMPFSIVRYDKQILHTYMNIPAVYQFESNQLFDI